MKKKLLSVLVAMLVVAVCLSFAACAKKYTVTFVTDGGTVVAAQTVSEGGFAEKPEDPQKEDCIFDGWYRDEACKESFSFDEPISADVTVYAKWIGTHSFTYHANGGGEDETVRIPHGERATAKTLTRDGYYFVGWFSAAEGGSEYDFGAVTADTDIYAHWAKYYTVHFETGEAAPIEDLSVYEGGILELPRPSLEGYRFAGWYRDAEFQELFNPGMMPSEDVTVYAQFLLSAGSDGTFQYTPYQNSAYSVSFQNGVTGSGELVIPDSYNGKPVVMIEEFGFEKGKMTSIVIPASVTEIGSGAFAECTLLTEAVIPETVQKLGLNIFADCSAMEKIDLPFCGTDRENATSGLSYIFGGSAPKTLKESILHYAVEVPRGYMSGNKMTNSTIEKITMPFAGQYSDGSGNQLFCWIFGAEESYENFILAPDTLREITILGGSILGRNCFSSLSNVTKITLPNTIKTIGQYAFSKLGLLTDLTLQEGLETIDEYAFQGCDSWMVKLPSTVVSLGVRCLPNHMTKIVLPKSLKEIGLPFFDGMTALTALEIDDGAPYFKTVDGILYDKEQTKIYACPQAKDASGYVVPATVTEIMNYAFYYVKTLTSFDFANIVAIGNAAFQSTGLTAVRLVKAETVGQYAFCALPMTSLFISASVTKIGARAFSSAPNLTDLTIEEGVEEMTFGQVVGETTTIDMNTGGNSMFIGDHALKSITFPSNWTTIPYGVVQGCNGLTEIIVKGEIKVIGYYAFAETPIETIEIMTANKAEIRSSAFSNCKNLKAVVLHNPVPPTIRTGAVDVFPTSVPIIVPTEAVEAYKAESSWEKYAANVMDTIPVQEFVVNTDGVLTAYNGSSANIVIPAGVKTIGSLVFKDMAFITSVTLNDDLEVIDKGAFENCTGLREIVIPASVTKLFATGSVSTAANVVFAGCSNLTKVTFLHETTAPQISWREFPSKPVIIVKETAKASFMALRSQTGIVQALIYTDEAQLNWTADLALSLDGKTIVKYLDGNALSYRIPDTITAIGESAFHGLYALKSIDLNKVETIGRNAFNTGNLSGTLTIPSTVTEIGNSAFSYCKITSVVIQDAAVVIGDYAFERLPLTSFDMGTKVLSLGGWFLNNEETNEDCEIARLVIPASVRGIKAEAFACARIGELCFAFSESYAQSRIDATMDLDTDAWDYWDEYWLDYYDEYITNDLVFNYTGA